MKKMLIPLTLLLLCANASFAGADTLADTSTATIIHKMPADTLAGTHSDTSSSAITTPPPADTPAVAPARRKVIRSLADIRADAPPSAAVAKDTTASAAHLQSSPPDEYAPGVPKKLKFGRRVAYNNSFVSGLSADVYSFDGEALVRTRHKNEAIYGAGFEISAMLFITVTDAAALHFAPAVIFRKPLNTPYAGVGEFAVAFPLLAEWRPYPSLPLFAIAGIQPELPLYTRLTWSDEPMSPESEPYSELRERSVPDFGIVIGVGAYPKERVAVDLRVNFGLSGFDRTRGRRLNQVSLGISYIH